MMMIIMRMVVVALVVVEYYRDIIYRYKVCSFTATRYNITHVSLATLVS